MQSRLATDTRERRLPADMRSSHLLMGCKLSLPMHSAGAPHTSREPSQTGLQRVLGLGRTLAMMRSGRPGSARRASKDPIANWLA